MAPARRVLGAVLALVVLILVFVGGWIVGRAGIGTVVKVASLSDTERQFADRMKDVRLVGTFNMKGREGQPPRSDSYEIQSVEKVGDNLWRFNARMHCCGVDGAIPIVLPMQFIGDTPVIMMTDTPIPGVGTFTVRLFFYGDEYAGTWAHGEAGGQMSGRLEKVRAEGF
jgi:hypothetical protein